MRIAAAVAAALVWSGPSRADDSVVLRAALSEGQVLRYDIDARLGLKASGREEVLEQRLRLRFTVAGVDREGAVVRASVESVRVKTLGVDAAEFEWKEGDGPGAEQEAPLAAMYRQLGGTIFEVVLDAKGAIREVSGLDRVPAAGKGLANPARALGVLEPEAAARMLQGIFSMDPGGGGRKAGDTWTIVQDVVTGVWRAKAATRYTVKQVGTDTARVEGETVLELPGPRAGEEDARPRSEITSQAVTIGADWSVKDSRLLRRLTEGTVAWKATIPVKEPIVASSVSTSRVEITLVEDRSLPVPGK